MLALTFALTLFYVFYASRPYLYFWLSLSRARNSTDPPPSEAAWVTLLLPIYNESLLILDRFLKACTSFHFERYDVTLADDSTNSETLSVLGNWKNHERIRIVHRASRDGFKGAALQNALSQLGLRTTNLLIFDADIIPDPDDLTTQRMN